ncbi:DUF6415 family natural product biosynthesis protein [Streptomyces sp. CJ_13]|uniref:DUF6415 family natural product biosynthesis protein n=1 Tax=Streptomyces sp. CJ_13 TaxID=2724943 RepID=UPI00202A2B93|nr:DUF6415 family natural product biosynthesis protein [Streptomyces sp. CJ_13]
MVLRFAEPRWQRVRPAVPSRDLAVAVTETVTLVLGEESPLPETEQDIVDLVRRLRGHVMQLGAVVLSGPALDHAREISGGDPPDGYLPSRVYLRQLAEATQDLVRAANFPPQCEERRALGPGRWRVRRPSRNALRGMVFAVAVAILIIAASVPRP